MNKVTLIGRLTKEVEIKQTQSGKAVATFTLAVNRRLTKEQRDSGAQSADFLPCVAWGRTAEIARQYLHRGSKAAVEGRIQARSYDAQDGSKRYVTEIIINELELLDSKNSSNQSNPQDEEIPF